MTENSGSLVGRWIRAKKDGFMNDSIMEIFCKVGKCYKIFYEDNDTIEFIDERGEEHGWDKGKLLDNTCEYFELCSEDEVVAKTDVPTNSETQWTDKHYDNWYKLTPEDIKLGKIKIDPYFVNRIWKLNEKDDTGVLFHNLKTLNRWGVKNTVEREVKALIGQTKRLAELLGVRL